MGLQQELKKKHPFQSPEQEAYVNLARTYAQLSAPLAAVLKPHGLSETTYNLLRVLRGVHDYPEDDHRALPCHEVADRLITRVPDITRLIDRLEQSGWVRRRRCTQDRRVVYLEITDAGLKLLAQLDEPVAAVHREQFSHLPEHAVQKLIRLLTRARETPTG